MTWIFGQWVELVIMMRVWGQSNGSDNSKGRSRVLLRNGVLAHNRCSLVGCSHPAEARRKPVHATLPRSLVSRKRLAPLLARGSVQGTGTSPVSVRKPNALAGPTPPRMPLSLRPGPGILRVAVGVRGISRRCAIPGFRGTRPPRAGPRRGSGDVGVYSEQRPRRSRHPPRRSRGSSGYVTPRSGAARATRSTSAGSRTAARLSASPMIPSRRSPSPLRPRSRRKPLSLRKGRVPAGWRLG